MKINYDQVNGKNLKIFEKITRKIKFILLTDIFPKKFVKNEFLFSLMLTFISETKLINVGNKLKVIMNETINPNVIIQPKSIIGFISLKINERNAQIVVSTV